MAAPTTAALEIHKISPLTGFLSTLGVLGDTTRVVLLQNPCIRHESYAGGELYLYSRFPQNRRRAEPP